MRKEKEERLMEELTRKENVTQRLREMKPGDTLILPARRLTALRSTVLNRLRKELIAEKADWVIGKQDPITGEFAVRRITRTR